MIQRKKAQGALEFLMTYGWAFLVILIMIGALAYFGVLDPSKFLPDRCNFSSQFECPSGKFVIDSTGTNDYIKIALVNRVGTPIKVTGLDTESKTALLNGCKLGVPIVNPTSIAVAGKTAKTFGGTPPGVSDTWYEGDEAVLTFKCADLTNKLKVGKKEKVTLKMTWQPENDAAFSKTIQGEIYAAVQ